MPTYNFINKKTGEEYSEIMSISELEVYLKENPQIEQSLCAPAIVSGISTRLRPDRGFRELLGRINKGKKGPKINDFGGGGGQGVI
jgi:hypothetical protein